MSFEGSGRSLSQPSDKPWSSLRTSARPADRERQPPLGVTSEATSALASLGFVSSPIFCCLPAAAAGPEVPVLPGGFVPAPGRPPVVGVAGTAWVAVVAEGRGVVAVVARARPDPPSLRTTSATTPTAMFKATRNDTRRISSGRRVAPTVPLALPSPAALHLQVRPPATGSCFPGGRPRIARVSGGSGER